MGDWRDARSWLTEIRSIHPVSESLYRSLMTAEEQAELDEVRAQLDELVAARLNRSLPVIELSRYERLIEREAELLAKLHPSDA